jgi:segregation and condensation protein B
MTNETNPELKNIIEAALLVAGQPLTLDKMAAMFPEDSRPTREELRATLDALAADYASRGIELREIGKGWRVQTRERCSPYIQKLVEERPPRYSRALLETLAIIAYRQPVTRGDIEDIRGVAVSSDIVRTLLERDWIREVGRREVPGRPVLYGTTRQFLEYFNLAGLDSLPPLSELRPIEEIGAELDKRLADQVAVATGGESREASAVPAETMTEADAASEAANEPGREVREPEGVTLEAQAPAHD